MGWSAKKKKKKKKNLLEKRDSRARRSPKQTGLKSDLMKGGGGEGVQGGNHNFRKEGDPDKKKGALGGVDPRQKKFEWEKGGGITLKRKKKRE